MCVLYHIWTQLGTCILITCHFRQIFPSCLAFLAGIFLRNKAPYQPLGFGHWCTVSGITKTVMSLTPNIFDMARIERLLVSMNAKLGTVESILIRSDDENREGWNNAEE